MPLLGGLKKDTFISVRNVHCICLFSLLLVLASTLYHLHLQLESGEDLSLLRHVQIAKAT